MENRKVLDRIKHNARYISAVSSLGISSLAILPAAAAGTGTGTGTTTGTKDTAGEIVGTMIGYVLKIFQYIGFFLLAWGVAQLVLAFKNEDADSKSRAMMVLVTAIILVTIKLIITTIIDLVDPTMASYIK